MFTCLHVVKSKVDIFVVLSLDNMLQSDNVLMAAQSLNWRTWWMASGRVIAALENVKRVTCRYIISLKVLCASVAFLKASKHFFNATTALDLFSTAFQTTPYAPFPNRWQISNLRTICLSISSDMLIRLNWTWCTHKRNRWIKACQICNLVQTCINPAAPVLLWNRKLTLGILQKALCSSLR